MPKSVAAAFGLNGNYKKAGVFWKGERRESLFSKKRFPPHKFKKLCLTKKRSI